MRNREAARYARWAAIAAGLVVLFVVGVYAKRALRVWRLRRELPALVSKVVQQSSADFTYSDVEQGRTVFTIRASHATQFKDKSRALLQDVWITIYGRDGSRNDNLHTRECNYEPSSGAIRCAGEVQISLQDAQPQSAKVAGTAAANSLTVKTRDVSFNRETGEASTPSPVEFEFPAGRGRGVGVKYSTRDSVMHIEHDVEFDLAASERTGGMPVSAMGSRLDIRRDDRTVVLGGPATVHQDGRELSADQISVNLDENFRAQRAVAEGHASVHSIGQGAKVALSADKLDGRLNPSGWIEHISVTGKIEGTREITGGTQRFSAAQVEMEMFPGQNAPREMVASGGVTGESTQGEVSQTLKTASLRVTFSAPAASVVAKAARATGDAKAADQRGLIAASRQRIESAETLAPATIESKSAEESTSLRAAKFSASLGDDGRLSRLVGHGDVHVQRQTGKGGPQTSSADELTAGFDRSGEWSELDETGNVRFRQDDRQAQAAHARIVRATGEINLDGAPVLSDAVSRTTAATVAINQTTGALRASGGVTSAYTPAGPSDAMSLGAGPAHVSADSVSGSTTSGHVVYSGHARLWQGDSVLDADQIEVWRDEKKLQASGHVFAVFPQQAGSLPVAPGASAKAGAGAAKPGAPESALWQVRVPEFTYSSDEGKAHLAGGVVASSGDESIASRTLDVFLAPASADSGVNAHPGLNPTQKAGGKSETAPGGRQLSRVLAQGSVVVREGDRRGEAERAEYTAVDGKFVLSGGMPMLINASSDTTTGHSLTFFVANDTILIDSQEGSRTLTRHRVEK